MPLDHKAAFDGEMNTLPLLKQETDKAPFYGLGAAAFADDVAKVLQAPLNGQDVEIKPGSLCSPLLATAQKSYRIAT